MMTIFTVGYEGHSVVTFCELLNLHEIEHVIDVRRIPFSRKRGFSKSSLGPTLASSNVIYTHLVELGTPDQLRMQLKRDADYDRFFQEVAQYIESQQEALNVALDIALTQRSALLCLEADPAYCHRSVVAAKLVQLSNLELTVEHV